MFFSDMFMDVIFELYGKAEFKKANFSVPIIYTGLLSFFPNSIIRIKTIRSEVMWFRFDQLEQFEELDRPDQFEGGSSIDSIYE